MKIRPQITVLFLSSVLTVLLIIAAIFPKNGIPLIGNLRLRFASPSDIFSTNQDHYADISDIIDTNNLLTDSIIDQLSENTVEETWDTVRANADSLRKSICLLQLPKNNKRFHSGTFCRTLLSIRALK